MVAIAEASKFVAITEKPIADFSFTEDCTAMVFYEPSLINAVTVDQWLWHFGDGDSSLLQKPNHLFLSNSSFQSNLCCFFLVRVCASDAVVKNVLIDKLYPFCRK